MSRRRSRSASPGRFSRSCSSNDPRDLERRIFVGNLPTSDMEKKDLEDMFNPYGKIVGVSLFRGFGFVQFECIEEAEAAKAAQKGRIYKDYKIDVNMAVERRQAKPQIQQSPPRRAPYSSYGDTKEARPRSRSPVYGRDGGRDGRDGREPRDSRDGRAPSREPRPGSHSRDPDYRYRSSENRDKDLRSDPRDSAYSREDYDRLYRSGSGADDYYRRKDETYRDPFRDPWNGRREPEALSDERARPEERRRNELYRQYYEELQRRYDSDRPVDCSVIVVNKTQNREYAETVGRKVRDLGMVVDLIFLNTEVSLTQALEDVGRARTPFAIIITQQHQVHRSCTVNILFGTPQEHRNMPMQDAMMLVAHNYDTYKVENREKEREEIARKAAKMADDVLLREPDRESHPVSVLTAITLLSENRFVTPEELDSLVAYLKDKRARLLRSTADPHADILSSVLSISSYVDKESRASRFKLSSNDPRDLERRIFVGNLPTSDMEKKDLEDMFNPYGKIVGVSMFRGFGFVQFERIDEAEAAKAAQKGRIYKGYKIDVNMAVERRQAKPQTQQSPPRRAPYSSYGDTKEARPRSRSPVYGREGGRDGREGREPRGSRDGRAQSREPRPPSREPRPSSHSRDPDYRYRSSDSRDKDLRSDPRNSAYSREDYDRLFRSGSGADDYYRRKEEPYRDPFRDPWNGRREPEADDSARPAERRRNELYRQYYEELQRRYDSDRPVDCSVIVVNKTQNREYAETVGRKVRDLGMVVDLIFLNTEVSLTQALEDVGRARTPFAIIITQQHQVHRSCTVNILFGTPQEHRNMPMQDAMMLVAHNYDTYKVENREKEREEIARKAAKMADDVLLREPDRESHPVSVLTAITLLSENRFVTPEELDSLVAYLKDKRARLLRSTAEPHAASVHAAPSAASHHDIPLSSAGLPPSHSTHTPSQSSHLSISAGPSPSANPSNQQELQAKILSLFNSGTGVSGAAGGPLSAASSQSQIYGSLGPSSSQSQTRLPMPGPPPAGSQGYGQSGHIPVTPGGPRPPSAASGINFDNPSVQKALDTLIQSGPSLNHLVGSGTSQPPPPRSAPSMGQVPPMSMYPRHY
ncbi:nuclear receptor coactivator 5 [Scomber scombrus]|nr:nuclear receptor coactivator 5 [Scomber scombrus]